MAKSTNKIRARDMDEQLLLALQTGASSGDISDFLTNYVAKSDTIELSQINNAQLKDFLNQQQYLSGQIKLTDLSTEVINYIANSAGTNYNPGIANTDIVTLNERVTELQELAAAQRQTIESLTSRILVLEDAGIDMSKLDLSDYMKKSEYSTTLETIQNNITRLGDTIENIEGDVSNITNNVTNIENKSITTNQLDQTIQNQLSKITNLETQIENFPDKYLPMPSTGTKGFIYYNDAAKKTYCKPTAIPCYIYTTAAAVNTAKSSKLDPIVDVSTSTIWYYNSSTDGYTSESLKGDNSLYEGCSLINLDTEALEYVIADDNIFKITSAGGSGSGSGTGSGTENQAVVTIYKYTLQKGQSITINRLNNLDKMQPLTLVKDTETGSRTKGKYINAEGVLTISNDNNGVTIYNDSGTIANIIVSMPQMDAVSTNNIRISTEAPEGATDGTIWFDKDNALIKFWSEDSQHWIIFSAAIE